MSWPELKELAHSSTREVERTFASRGRAEELPEDWTEEDSFRCLRAVASWPGVESVDPATYDRVRGEILAKNRGRWRHGRETVFPTANQIEYAFGGFVKGVVAAGLQPPESGSEKYLRTRGRSMTIVDALELHLETYGCLVPPVYVDRFSRAYGFQLESDTYRPAADVLAELRSRRDAKGLWTPSGYPPTADRPRYSEEGTPALWSRRESQVPHAGRGRTRNWKRRWSA